MMSRFALRITLPLVLLAVAFTAILWVGRDSGALQQVHVQSTEADIRIISFASGEKPDASATDPTQWNIASRSLDGVTISYRYPAGWSAELTYCVPGADISQPSGHLPSGCASTDFLVGQKARDVGPVEGTPMKVGDKTATRLVESAPGSVLVSQIYTLMVYDDMGSPLLGINTLVGPNTDPKTINDIISSLDA